jgi:putative glycosyltransferase
MKLSIVTTLFQSADCVSEFCDRVSVTAQKFVGDDYEIVLVDDGSPDNSLDIAIELAETDKHILVVELSRNFGHHKAMMTGLMHSNGDLIYLIDSDLEEEPEWLLKFSRKMHDEKCDVVYGAQEIRKGNITERLSGMIFYKVFNLLTGMDLPKNVVTARLMSRAYVNALLLHKERELMIAGLWQITGFRQSGVTITKHNTSKTTYSFKRKMEVLVNSVTSFSNKPLHYIFYTGITVSTIACCYIIFLLYRNYFHDDILSGWTSVMASIWLLGGFVISFMGVIAIYLSKIFIETKQRPYSIVREVYSKNNTSVNKE